MASPASPGRACSSTTPTRLRGEADRSARVRCRLQPGRGDPRDAARWLIWSASQALGCGSASIHELYMARGRGRVPADHVHRAGHQRPSRRLPDRAPGLLAPRWSATPARSSSRSPSPRWPIPTSAPPSTPRSSWPPPSARAGGPGLPAGRPLPVQRHQVGGRPGRGDVRPQAAHQRGGGGRLPEHRHRQQHARRPLPADRRPRSSGSTSPTPWS